MFSYFCKKKKCSYSNIVTCLFAVQSIILIIIIMMVIMMMMVMMIMMIHGDDYYYDYYKLVVLSVYLIPHAEESGGFITFFSN